MLQIKYFVEIDILCDILSVILQTFLCDKWNSQNLWDMHVLGGMSQGSENTRSRSQMTIVQCQVNHAMFIILHPGNHCYYAKCKCVYILTLLPGIIVHSYLFVYESLEQHLFFML